MNVLQPIYTKSGDFYYVTWKIVGRVPEGLTGADAIAWAKNRGFLAPVLEPIEKNNW